MKHNKCKGEDQQEQEVNPKATDNLVGFFHLLFEIDTRITSKDGTTRTPATRSISKQEKPPVPTSSKDYTRSVLNHELHSTEILDRVMPQEWVSSELSEILTIRVSSATLGRLRSLARERGIGPSTLVRMWILDRLNEMEQRQVENGNANP